MINKTISDKEFKKTLKAIQSGKKKSLAEAFPDLSKEWHPYKNNDLTPDMVTPGSGQKVYWKCSYGHEWSATVENRTNGKGCPYCSGRKVWIGFNDLKTTHPTLAKEWHPTKNGDLTPTKISRGYSKPVYWQCTHCGHEYQRSPNQQTQKDRNPRCPHCKTPVNSSSDSDKIPS